MNRRLADERCTPCREGERPLSGEDLASLCESLSRWKLESQEGIARIVKNFLFKTAMSCAAFARRVKEIADREDHHPEMSVEETRVTVSWWTHSLRGLSRNDFVMAAKTDRVNDEIR